MLFPKATAPISYLSKNICRSLSALAVPKEKKIKINNYTINYVKVGNGPHHILFLPGALGTIWTEAKPQVEGFNREKFTLVAWDPPGYGKSRPPERQYMADYLQKDADTAYEFMKALEIPKYSVLGFSDGGRTALIHTAKYPDAVNKLVVWSTNSFILPHEIEWLRKHRDISSWKKSVREPLIAIYGEQLLTKYWTGCMDAQETFFKANNGNIFVELLKNINCPTYILHGQKDNVVDSVHVSHFLNHINHARTHLYPEGTHHIHLMYAEDFNQRVQEFLLTT